MFLPYQGYPDYFSRSQFPIEGFTKFINFNKELTTGSFSDIVFTALSNTIIDSVMIGLKGRNQLTVITFYIYDKNDVLKIVYGESPISLDESVNYPFKNPHFKPIYYSNDGLSLVSKSTTLFYLDPLDYIKIGGSCTDNTNFESIIALKELEK